MNEVGYDVMALSNHEFDFGQAKVADYVSAATFPIVSANIVVDATGKNLVDPSCVFTLRDGRKVGVFGLTIPETYTSASPLMIQGLTFKQEKELYACAQEQVDELRDQGCSLIICLGHLGEEESVAPNRAQDVAANVRGIDLLIDGHDHEEEGQTLRDAEGNETLVVEAGCYTHMVGIVTWEDGKLKQQAVKFGEYDGQDAGVAANIQKVSDEVDEKLGEIVGTTAFLLDGERDPGVRTEETNLGDFVADALLWEAQLASDDTPQCAIMNGGGIRMSVQEGDITVGDVIDVAPFFNYLHIFKVPGSKLLEALEASCSETPDAMGGFPQASGIEYTINASVPYEKGKQYPKSTFYAPAKPGSRVAIKTIDGAPFDEKTTYTVAASDFIGAGGDTYHAFTELDNDAIKDTGCIVYDAITHCLKEGCKGEVGEQYAKPQGRIEIIAS